MTSTGSPLERLAALPRAQRERLLADEARKHNLTPAQLKAQLSGSWRFVGRPKQQQPAGDWTFWYILAGRGFGKTLTAAQWVKPRGLERRCRIGVIAPTLGDCRAVCFEGETGMLAVLPNEVLLGQSRSVAWNKSLLELTLANGTIIKGFSSEEPDRLRGPQHDYLWGEEVSSWRDARLGDAMETTWSNAKLGMRLGPHPRAVLTSTPKANKLTHELVELAGRGSTLRLVRGSSYENRANLSDAWWDAVVAPLEGTRTGRQEIEAELLEDVEGALWRKSQLDLLRVDEAPPLRRIIVGVDPNVSSGVGADDAGIVVAGEGQRQIDGERFVFVLDDRTQTRGGPRAWAQATVDAYHDYEADLVAVEANNGGEMCELTIHTVDPNVPVKILHASRGKRTRAEPVAALYDHDDERGRVARVRHVGPAARFAELEDEMTTWVPGEESPNRMDALVWAVTELKVWDAPPKRMRTFVPRGRIPTAADRFSGGGY